MALTGPAATPRGPRALASSGAAGDAADALARAALGEGPPPDPGTPSEVGGPAPPLPRFLQMPFAEPMDHVPGDLPAGIPVLVTEAADGFHEAVLAGVAAVDGMGHLVPRAILDEEGALASWVEAAAPGGGALALVHLDARAPMPDLAALDLAAWRAIQAAGTKRLWGHLRDLAPRLAAGGRVVVASETGGLFGRVVEGGPGLLSAAPGATGLVKALSLEWPGCSLKAVDLDPEESPGLRARHLLRELAVRRGRREAGYPRGRRTILRAEPASLAPPIAPTPADLRPDAAWVVLATDGGRGIAAECLRSLAPSGCRLLLVGGPPLSGPEPPHMALLDAGGLRRLLLDEARARGEGPRLAEIEAEARRHLGAREMRANVDGLAALGATVEAHAVDAADEAAMAALLADLYGRLGRIDLVVHGAGPVEGAPIGRKSRASFDRVFDAKVDPAFLLARHLRRETLRGFCLLASVAGRYGQHGHTDGAAASETLNRLAWELRRRWGPGAAVKAINWGPWATTGGGSSPGPMAAAQALLARGIGLVEPQAGSEAFRREMLWSPPGDVETVAWLADGEALEERATGLPEPQNGADAGARPDASPEVVLLRRARLAPPRPAAPGGQALVLPLDLVSAPFLDHHRFDGHPVMPVAAVVQALAELPLALGEGPRAPAVEDLRLLGGIRLEGGRPLDLLLTLGAEADGAREATVAALDRPARALYRARLRSGPTTLPSPLPRPPAAPWAGPGMAHIYRRWLSHGPRLQTVEALRAVTPQVVRARLRGTRPQDLAPVPPECAWTFDPGLVDGMLQLLWVFARVMLDASALPVRIERIVRGDGDPLLGPVEVEVAIRTPADEPSLLCDLQAIDAAGQTVCAVEGFHGQAARSLNRLSGGWAGGQRS